ncbi:MAG: copper resistance protein CopA [Alteromonadaceae bacterium]|jgi:CopA family copper-resistance protein|uniref:Copper resistance protein A n=1 Tax=Paraglaciecola agarilytica NO2 TaxID=1125747 RepID=A0ABQ0I162_9ALTE|nr:copper resistance system multicopper oxidase [Paraglaciecola agarilytica]MBN26973.1 copper resistance protein CopA [Alteromonadaceae bacterium]GAC03056.1 copper resistance protein A [Paraglaciecola agarilytica NO2]|tara:strand:- start:12543 stop:14345 length:1803 start_codon:yes stop_codon:yes gene_type:complete
MSKNNSKFFAPTCVPRRHFVKGTLAGSIAIGMGNLGTAFSQEHVSSTKANTLTGNEFDLTVSETSVNFTGNVRTATTINGSIPAPTLVWREGETVTIRVTNRLSVSTSIHWHGIILPYQMDGVPGISYPGIAPGETFTYRFKVQQAGTYWYHSHTGFQEMTGMYGSIIIQPKAGEKITTDQDMVVQLSDWTDENPMSVFAHLKQQSDYYNYNQPTARDFFNDVSRYGIGKAVAMRKMWNEMRMSPTDLADVSATTFTFLMNGQTPNGNWTGVFKPGETLRLRFINGSSNTFFDVRIPGLKLKVVSADGQDVEPVSVDEFRFGPGETYDVVVKPTDDAHSIFAQSMDRTGYTRGTLAVQQGLIAEVPVVDKPVWLAMKDMMGNMAQGDDMSGMDHGSMPIDHSAMGHGAKSMDHSQHAMNNSPLAIPSQTVNHARSEYGPSVDSRVEMPRTNLDDPGIGLRNNGRRVLTLADLHTLGGPFDPRLPEREVELHLTGNMERYTWSFDGLEFGKSTPVHFRHGERVRVILQNDTMMTHPMHLHGVWSDLENDKGEFMARRHTIPVQPAQRISFLVTADALGRWAWHCHLLFHMDAGMFREVVIS